MDGQITSKRYSPEYLEALKVLTPREIEVLEGVYTGRTSREIGQKLNISIHTVQKHREEICRKLGLRGYRALFHWSRKYMNHGYR